MEIFVLSDECPKTHKEWDLGEKYSAKEENMDKSKGLIQFIETYMPTEISEAVREYLGRTHTDAACVNEIRLRSYGRVGLVVSGRNVLLGVSPDKQRVKEVFKKICDCAIFSHKDEICRGFVTLPTGVRVGVCGHARYDEHGIVGVTDVASLVFRIPSGECSFAGRLYRDWLRLGGGGMLICSRAGEGKTTAIRALARLIGSGSAGRRVVVVDERCEFDPNDYRDSQVDVLRGYRRALGIDIAVRTMSAEVIIVDEISAPTDARALLSSVGAGASVIATVHASALEGALGRDYVSELVTRGLFESVCTVSRSVTGFSYSIEKMDIEEIKKRHGKGDKCCI